MYNFHSDCGHGWLEVPRAELVALGIADKISHYSYQKGDRVYLEEDCDAAVFRVARGFTSWDGIPTRDIVSKHDDSPIRRYERYTA
jgi:hypothetical protein